MKPFQTVTRHVTMNTGGEAYTIAVHGNWFRDSQEFELTGFDWHSGDFHECLIDFENKRVTMAEIEEKVLNQLIEEQNENSK